MAYVIVDNAFLAVMFLIQMGTIVRVILRPYREPASRAAWIMVIAVIPGLGIIAYLLFGETNIGRRRLLRGRKIFHTLPALVTRDVNQVSAYASKLPDKYRQLFKAAQSISGFQAFAGNAARIYADSNEMIDALVDDIDNARLHVHLLFYIWLADNNGHRVAEALKRAASRGIECRAMADSLGSHGIIQSSLWKEMQAAGVKVAVALPIGNPVMRILFGRIDLRNHRKIVVIDDHITYCGSQNCADPEFRIKPRYAPWVDAVMRFQGPVARQNQHLFVSDWMTSVDEDLSAMLTGPLPEGNSDLVAEAFGTGPTVRHSAMPEMFELLMFNAREEICITTPYYVPDEAMQNALCSAALRGVQTTIIFPAKNDSRIVAAASRSYYSELLAAGVRIFEYEDGLLHAKTFTVDGEISLIGSANMDRRSFELNYENNILFYDPDMTNELKTLQIRYIAKSRTVTMEHVASWSMLRKLWNNTVAIVGPVL